MLDKCNIMRYNSIKVAVCCNFYNPPRHGKPVLGVKKRKPAPNSRFSVTVF